MVPPRTPPSERAVLSTIPAMLGTQDTCSAPVFELSEDLGHYSATWFLASKELSKDPLLLSRPCSRVQDVQLVLRPRHKGACWRKPTKMLGVGALPPTGNQPLRCHSSSVFSSNTHVFAPSHLCG